GIRAANLTLINIISLFFKTYFSFLADRFTISLKTFRIIHRLISIISFTFIFFHVFIVIVYNIKTFSLSVPENFHKLI
ncbi:hypothetical protein BKA65DRAFT_366236, partial [Rhexocercosporidium sp. MPI-PUGE-AT-0058]